MNAHRPAGPQKRPRQASRPRFALRAVCASLLLASVPHAFAADAAADLEQLRSTTLGLIQALVDQGLISRDRADALLRQAAVRPAASLAAAAAPAPAAAASGVVRVPYIPETLKAQIREEIKADVMSTARQERWADSRAIPSWVTRFGLEGDFRLRAQGESFAGDNLPAEVFRSQTESPSWSPDLMNTTHDRKRLTLRARLGANINVADNVAAGLRIVTAGASGSPTSGSSTLGTYFNRLNLSADRAWIRWEPRHDLRVEGGRMANPFFGTDLLWPDDLSLDGVSARAEATLASGVSTFLTAGAFPLEEFATTGADKWLYGVQLGTDWALGHHTQFRAGIGIYDFRNIEGVRESLPPPQGALAGTVPYQSSQYPASARQRGNTLININDPTSNAAPVWGLASKFRPVNVTAGATFSHFDPYTLGLSLDYVKNTGFDLADIQRRAGVAFSPQLADRTTGYQFRAQFGKPKLAETGDWQAFVAFRKFERDAWVDAFTDTTWNLGGTNYKGFSLGASYAIERNTSLGLRWTSTRNLDDGVRFLVGGAVSGNLSSAPQKIDVLQVEVNSRF